ncbi:hypothetical protein HDK77DRAFT_234596 [Phyllosticta capitalensis]
MERFGLRFDSVDTCWQSATADILPDTRQASARRQGESVGRVGGSILPNQSLVHTHIIDAGNKEEEGRGGAGRNHTRIHPSTPPTSMPACLILGFVPCPYRFSPFRKNNIPMLYTVTAHGLVWSPLAPLFCLYLGARVAVSAGRPCLSLRAPFSCPRSGQTARPNSQDAASSERCSIFANRVDTTDRNLPACHLLTGGPHHASLSIPSHPRRTASPSPPHLASPRLVPWGSAQLIT